MTKILHADDVARFRELVKLEFEPDCEVISLEDCDGVVQTASEQSPDVVILDHLMPSDKDLTGFDVCQQLRAKNPDLPIVVFTGAWEGEATQEEAEKIWGAKVVFKSEGTEELHKVVDGLLS